MSVMVIGAGGHAKVVVGTLLAAGHDVSGVLDDAFEAIEGAVLGVPVLGPTDRLGEHDGPAVLAIGNGRIRKRLAADHPEAEWLVVVHPRATVHASAHLGEGTVVFAGAVVQPDVRVGRHAIVNTGATIDHDSRLGDFVHIGPGVHLAGDVTVEEGGFLGIGACAVPGVSVGAWGTVGAGGVVVSDLPPNATSLGVPAHPVRRS